MRPTRGDRGGMCERVRKHLAVKNWITSRSKEALLPVGLVFRKIAQNSSDGDDSVVVIKKLMPKRVTTVKKSQTGVGTRFTKKNYHRMTVGQSDKVW